MVVASSKVNLLAETHGGLAQLARAPALHAGGHRFDSDILHFLKKLNYFNQQLLVALNCTHQFFVL